ncbi:hypothetical protein [Sedimentibacter sp. zth1]|nr:hypothetical protein [Sedimentibacter sp. zth1]
MIKKINLLFLILLSSLFLASCTNSDIPDGQPVDNDIISENNF